MNGISCTIEAGVFTATAGVAKYLYVRVEKRKPILNEFYDFIEDFQRPLDYIEKSLLNLPPPQSAFLYSAPKISSSLSTCTECVDSGLLSVYARSNG
jgi:hypothetical protein